MRRSALRHIRRETGRSDCIRMQKNASGPGQHVQQANGAKQMFNADFAVLVTSVITSKPANGYHFKTGQWPTFGGTRFSTPSPPDQASAFLGFLTSKFPDS